MEKRQLMKCAGADAVPNENTLRISVLTSYSNTRPHSTYSSSRVFRGSSPMQCKEGERKFLRQRNLHVILPNLSPPPLSPNFPNYNPNPSILAETSS